MPTAVKPAAKPLFKNKDFYAFVVKYMNRNYAKWRIRYPNIVGAHIAQKTKKGKATRSYAIIFHVVEKTGDMDKKLHIPPHFTASWNKVKYKIPTDVIKSGIPVLHGITPGQNVFQITPVNNEIGCMGPIVFKDGKRHILSNMHVLGAGFHSFDIDKGQPDLTSDPDICYRTDGNTKRVAYFVRGLINDAVDAAIALIPDDVGDDVNEQSEIIDVKHPVEFPPDPAPTPLDVLVLRTDGIAKSTIINTAGTQTFDYHFKEATINNLLFLSPRCTQKGDSGSAVFDAATGAIAGIVVGGSALLNLTFAIPFTAIKTALTLDEQ